ncbi:hypothetical protein XO12_03380, partial [Marinitoga sp. 1154]
MTTNLLISNVLNNKVSVKQNKKIEKITNSKKFNINEYIVNNKNNTLEKNNNILIKKLSISIKKIYLPKKSSNKIKKIPLGKNLKPVRKNFKFKSFSVNLMKKNNNVKNFNNDKLKISRKIFLESVVFSKNTKEINKVNKIIKELIGKEKELPEGIKKEVKELKEMIEAGKNEKSEKTDFKLIEEIKVENKIEN